MIRVLDVIHGPAYGGAHNQVSQLRAPLAARGVEVEVVLPAGAPAVERLRAEGVTVHEMPLSRLRATPSPPTQARFLASTRSEIAGLAELLRDGRFDAVQVHGITNPQGALAARRAGDVAVSWQIFDTRAPMALRRAMAPVVRRLADSMTSWGDALVRAHPGIDRLGERIVTVFPPVDLDRFQPREGARTEARERLGVDPERRLIGSVGVLNPQKGHEYTVRSLAAARRSHPDLQARVLGADSPAHAGYMAGVRAEANELGLETGTDIDFIDPGSDVDLLIHAFDALVLTSVPRSEGMPTVLLEAMASGVPVLATDVGAVAELIEDGRTGLLVPPLNVDAMAAAIVRVLEDPDLRDRMSADALEAARTRWSIDELADRHLSAIEIAIQHRRAARVTGSEVKAREQAFFDADTGNARPEDMPPREYSPYDSRFEDALIDAVGPLEGKEVLDLGCGAGDLSLRLIDRGAIVTGIDLSPASVELARRRTELFRPDSNAGFLIAAAEATGLESERFDVVVGKWVLHHTDISGSAAEVERVLKPGGVGVFIETSGLNPLLAGARRHLVGRPGVKSYGTPDEHPITADDLETLGRWFPAVEVDFPETVFFFLIERHILRWRAPGTDRLLRGLDAALQRTERWRRLSYYVRIRVVKDPAAGPAQSPSTDS